MSEPLVVTSQQVEGVVGAVYQTAGERALLPTIPEVVQALREAGWTVTESPDPE